MNITQKLYDKIHFNAVLALIFFFLIYCVLTFHKILFSFIRASSLPCAKKNFYNEAGKNLVMHSINNFIFQGKVQKKVLMIPFFNISWKNQNTCSSIFVFISNTCDCYAAFQNDLFFITCFPFSFPCEFAVI